MSIRIHTKTLQSAGGGSQPPDTYTDKIVKYIPSDVIAAWVAATSAIKAAIGAPQEKLLWAAFAFGLFITAVWRMRKTKLPLQAAISTGAFGVWVFALGGPFEKLAWYNPIYGTLLLIGYTLITAAVNPD